jgi:hypothetical protein
MNSNTPAKKILILAANPKQTSRLRLDEEVRDIKEGLRLSQQRDKNGQYVREMFAVQC